MKVISTLGPACLTGRFIELCFQHRQPYFRLNGSHLGPWELQTNLEFIKEQSAGQSAVIYLDLQGEKKRIGKLAAPLSLSAGQEVTCVQATETNEQQIPISQPELFHAIQSGDRLVFQDAALSMIALRVSQVEITLRVEAAGELRSNCGILIEGRPTAGTEFPAPQKDQIRLAAEAGIDFLALSYLREEAAIKHLRNECDKMAYHPKIAAKIERPEALSNLQKIAEAADELWFCRGDLGTFIPLRELGVWQDRAIAAAKLVSKPVIIAGQVFQHLADHSQPTRSEVVHFHYIKREGAEGIVLSDETAIGIDPGKAVAAIFSLL